VASRAIFPSATKREIATEGQSSMKTRADEEIDMGRQNKQGE